MTKVKLCFVLVFILGLSFWNYDYVCAEQVSQKVAVINFPALNEQPNTISVGPLVARQSDQAWLSKAIADLLIKNLSEVESLIVLERGAMQAFSDELGLNDSALFNQEKALRVGRVAKVNTVIFGNYNLQGDNITISIYLMELSTKKILLQDEISGRYVDIRSLVKKLTTDFLNKQQVALSDKEKRRIQFKATDSITATEHYYRGIDFYDQGKYPEAFGEFLKASRQDSKYIEAQLWIGRMFEAQGFYDDAVLAYEDLFKKYPRSIEARDALSFAAKVLDYKLNDPARAIKIYRKLTRLKPVNPHSLEASFYLGELLYKEGDILGAFKEFRKVDDFRQKIVKNPLSVLRSDFRTSSFVSWVKVLNLYKESIVKMASLYALLAQEYPVEELPPAPRGVIFLNPDAPNFKETVFKHTQSLFPAEEKYSTWHEELYVVIVPKGFVATGVDFSITGSMVNPTPTTDYTFRILPFPLPRDFSQHWMGVIFGQTAKRTTLSKSISFHGKNRRIFTLQLVENHSTIHDWSIDVKLTRGEPVEENSNRLDSVNDDTFWEGKPVAQIPLQVNELAGTTRLQQDSYRSRKEMDLLHDPMTGTYLVSVQGELDGEQTDLWLSSSKDGVRWSSLERLDINSSSEDFNPRIVRSEDGKIHLFWISNRRGKGWELWSSHLNSTKRWSRPQRIPLEDFVNPGLESKVNNLSNYLLEFDVYQDNRGRWIVAYYSYKTIEMVLLKSTDTKKWSLLSKFDSPGVSTGVSLIQDSSAVYRVGFSCRCGSLEFFSSNDGINWSNNSNVKKSLRIRLSLSLHRMRLFPLEYGKMLMLFSDSTAGLQYGRFNAGVEKPMLDLVARVNMEAFAVTEYGRDDYLVAIKGDRRITIRNYKHFNASGEEIDKDAQSSFIYNEVEKDGDDNEWTRIFPYMRSIVPDVISLGVEPSGRLWWGIETGIAHKDGDIIQIADVSQGFFHHYITDIATCDDGGVWLSSKSIKTAKIGFVKSRIPARIGPINIGKATSLIRAVLPVRVRLINIARAEGAITASACGKNGSDLFVGTDHGSVIGYGDNKVFFEYKMSADTTVTSIAVDTGSGDIWVGTNNQGLIKIGKNKSRTQYNKEKNLPGNHVTDLVIDKAGALWVAVYGGGLTRLSSGKWESFTPENSNLLYWSISHLTEDPSRGIWYLPYDDVASKGLGYFDGMSGASYNPPHKILENPSSLVVEESGVLWVGTWFNGLYKMERSN